MRLCVLTLHSLETDVGHFGGDVHDLGLNAGGSHTLFDVVDVLFVRLTDVRGERLHLHACVEKHAADCLGIKTARHANAYGLALQVFQLHLFFLVYFTFWKLRFARELRA